MSEIKNVLKLIKENDITYIDLRFTDPRGKMQHVSQHVSTITEDSLNEGFMFDGSSIAGWKAINESDMLMKPDLSRTFTDPFLLNLHLQFFVTFLNQALKLHMKGIPDQQLRHLLII